MLMSVPSYRGLWVRVIPQQPRVDTYPSVDGVVVEGIACLASQMFCFSFVVAVDDVLATMPGEDGTHVTSVVVVVVVFSSHHHGRR